MKEEKISQAEKSAESKINLKEADPKPEDQYLTANGKKISLFRQWYNSKNPAMFLMCGERIKKAGSVRMGAEVYELWDEDGRHVVLDKEGNTVPGDSGLDLVKKLEGKEKGARYS
ncbi:MAG: hypothetical protein US76_03755 [Parcubacteria group bacterium GW2011_GWA2_38_13b]|nr:MAG: hypothetical protein US76_03755 [Parcubacteria group bacterium GW2011_GWA2_38_13b]